MVSKNQILIAIHQPKTRGPQLTAKWNKVTAELPTVTRNVLSEVVVRVVSCHVSEVVKRVVNCHVSEVVMRVVNCHVFAWHGIKFKYLGAFSSL